MDDFFNMTTEISGYRYPIPKISQDAVFLGSYSLSTWPYWILLGKVTSGYSGFMVSVLALAVATTQPAAGGWCRSRGSPGAGVVYVVHFVPWF